MTTQEAIEILNREIRIDTKTGIILPRVTKAKKMAIQSLEAWKKVKDKIETEIPCYSETVPFHQGIRMGLNIASQIIDKHLKEVENDNTGSN